MDRMRRERPMAPGRNRADGTSEVPPLSPYRSTIAKDPSAARRSEAVHTPNDTSGAKAIAAAQRQRRRGRRVPVGRPGRRRNAERACRIRRAAGSGAAFPLEIPVEKSPGIRPRGFAGSGWNHTGASEAAYEAQMRTIDRSGGCRGVFGTFAHGGCQPVDTPLDAERLNCCSSVKQVRTDADDDPGRPTHDTARPYA
jgi:hypothetical protein